MCARQAGQPSTAPHSRFPFPAPAATAFGELFAALDKCEEILGRQRYIVGNRLTEADSERLELPGCGAAGMGERWGCQSAMGQRCACCVSSWRLPSTPAHPFSRPPSLCPPPAVRLFHTLIRFDHVYVSYFKTNRNFMWVHQQLLPSRQCVYQQQTGGWLHHMLFACSPLACSAPHHVPCIHLLLVAPFLLAAATRCPTCAAMCLTCSRRPAWRPQSTWTTSRCVAQGVMW